MAGQNKRDRQARHTREREAVDKFYNKRLGEIEKAQKEKRFKDYLLHGPTPKQRQQKRRSKEAEQRRLGIVKKIAPAGSGLMRLLGALSGNAALNPQKGKANGGRK